MNIYRLITLALSLPIFLGACTEPPVPPPNNYAFEIIPDGEANKIADIAKKTMHLQNKRAIVFKDQQDGQKLRGVHPKSHGCVLGELLVNEDIESNLQVGLFAKPGKRYKVLIRYSNASVRLSPDLENGQNGSRGMAIKVFDVDGKMLVNDKGANNQDFLMINTPGFAFPDVHSYQRLTNALVESPSGVDPRCSLRKPGSPLPPGLSCQEITDWTEEDDNNLNKTFKTLAQINSKVVRNPLEVAYFAAAPSSFGEDRVMKFSAQPCAGEKPQAAFANPAAISANYLHEALVSTMSKNEKVCLDLKIQVLNSDQVKADREKSGESGDIIEDATRVWDKEQFPFIKVAEITLSTPQTVDFSDATQQDCRAQAFNPWHSLTEHQPLGGINRLRKPVYINSAGNR